MMLALATALEAQENHIQSLVPLQPAEGFRPHLMLHQLTFHWPANPAQPGLTRPTQVVVESLALPVSLSIDAQQQDEPQGSGDFL